MSLLIEKDYFESVVLSATEATGNVFESLQGAITDAHSEACDLLGATLYNRLSADMEVDHPACLLAQRVKKWVVLRAYEMAIPHLDLVLTPTGFGIVSNQNTAPASADRVNRLLQVVTDAKEDAFDDLLDALRGQEDWHDSPVAVMYFSSLLWNARQLARYGFSHPHRSHLREARAKITNAELRLKEAISPEFFQELCDSVRHNTTSPQQMSAITYCLNVIGCELDNSPRESLRHCRQLVKFLDANIKDFHTYANSTAYEANNFKQYENAVNDSCYFFG